MVTVTDLFAIFLFYAFGWVGAFLLLMTASYVLSSIYRKLKLNEPANVSTAWRALVVSAYDWLNVDFFEEPISQSYLHFKLITLMAFVASMGTFVIIPALLLMLIAWLTITLWTNFS